jgi:hypothetical protein
LGRQRPADTIPDTVTEFRDNDVVQGRRRCHVTLGIVSVVLAGDNAREAICLHDPQEAANIAEGRAFAPPTRRID